MNQIKFTIPGEPQGKGRPRATRSGVVFTPKKTRQYENRVKAEYFDQCRCYKFPDDALLDMQIIAFYGVAKSDTKKVRQWKLDGQKRPNKKPDMDNVIKCVADALNEVAYHDDTQIVDCQVRKFFSENPRVEVTITEVGKDPTK